MLIIFIRSADCIVFSSLLSYVHLGCGQRVVNQCLGYSLCILDLIDRMESGFKIKFLFYPYTSSPICCFLHRLSH